MATVDKKLLKRLKLLYVEDDESVRNELSSLLSNFFENVYTAKNGKEGLSLYTQKQNDIDVIIADINMPELTGIEMLKKIREFDKDIPVIFATAYSDNEFLSEAIKLKVFEYIIKPIDIRNLMKILGELASILYHDFLINQQNKELKKYKDIIYNNNIVLRTNKNLKISFVNDLFCEITGFDKKELIGKELITLKHVDIDTNVYENIYNNILNNKQWNGQLKNITKDGSYYISDTSIISTLNDTGEVTGCLVIQKDETKEILKRREVQNYLIKDKGEIFIKSKESSAELQQEINSLKNEIEVIRKEVQFAYHERDKFIFTVDKYTKENKKLKKDISLYQKDSGNSQAINKKTVKLSKENSDLKVEVKRLEMKIEALIDDYKRELNQQKIKYEIELDDLEKELNQSNEKLDSFDNTEAVSQKLAYWKEKAKSEAKRAEKLERDIIQHGDKTIMAKLFGSK